MATRPPGLLLAAAVICSAVVLVACSPDPGVSPPGGLAAIPGGTVWLGSAAVPGSGGPRETLIEPFALGRHEVTVAQYCRYLNESPGQGPLDHPQIVVRSGHYLPAAGCHHKAVTSVSFDDAQAYCRWASARFGRRCRLPTADEWECAAHPGFNGAPYPWGWGDPHGRASFDLQAPLRVGLFPPNRFGLHDMAGGVAEWCACDDTAPGERIIKGGSWAERDPDQVAIYGGLRLPSVYRDADVGFRMAAEARGAVFAATQAHP